MAQNKLALYNVACLSVGHSLLDTLTENTEIRHDLDEVYSRGAGAVKFLLSKGLWNFAIRAVQIDASSSVSPAFGLSKAFDVPTDYVKLAAICSDERFYSPMTQYAFEGSYIYADIDPIYVKYVSDDSSWGGDQSRWTENFLLWAGMWMARQISKRYVDEEARKVLIAEEKRLLSEARSFDAMEEPTRFSPLNTWAKSRFGGSSRGDRGNRGQLIG